MPATLTTATSPSESATSSKPPESSPTLPDKGRRAGNRLWQVLLTLLAIESGAFLLVMPWTAMWDWTLLAGSYGALAPPLRNHFVRGAISAVGLLSIWVGFIEALIVTGVVRAAPRTGAVNAGVLNRSGSGQ